MPTYRRAGGRVRARRAARGSGTPRAASTSTSSPASRSTTPATATPRSSRRSATRPARLMRRLEPLSTRSRACGSPQRLAESSLGGQVFLCNSGAEANECAIKLARKHAHGRGIETPEIVVLEGAFHGRTLGGARRDARSSPATTSSARCRRASSPSPRDDPEALRAAVGESTAAVMIEPIQGEAGIHPISDEVLAAAREACDASGALLVLDEVQTGMGRTGSLWAYEQLPVRPDVMTAAEGARRRAAGRRLRDDRGARRRASSPATTARPSPAARSPPPRRSPPSR